MPASKNKVYASSADISRWTAVTPPKPTYRRVLRRIRHEISRPCRLLLSIARKRYRSLSWESQQTINVGIVMSAAMYLLLSIPFRIGLFYNPVRQSAPLHESWTSELNVFSTIDIVVDSIGLYEFIDFYSNWRDAFAQLSSSVSFELGKKMSKDAKKLASPKITLRSRKGSAGTWTVASINPSLTTSDATQNVTTRKLVEFTLEVIALLPLEIIVVLLNQFNTLHIVRLTKLCRVYRLQKCFDRLGKIYSNRYIVQQMSYTGISSLVKTVFWGMVMGHWLACGYIFIAHAQCGVFFELCDIEHETTWVIRDQLVGGSVARKYGRVLYWASRTIVVLGYDDVTPVSDGETVYALMVQVIGALMGTSLLATFLFIFRYRNLRYVAFTTHVDNAREYMRSQNIPKSVRRNVMAYFTYTWTTHHSLDSEEALHSMPKHLQSKVVYSLKASRVKQVCFLMKESTEFINFLALALVHRVYTPKDSIIEPKINAKMFFVIRGTVILTTMKGTQPKECQTGDFFADCCLLVPETYEEKATAKTFCELYVLDKARFDEALTHFYRGDEQKTRDRMAETLLKYSTQLRKTKKLLGLRDAESSPNVGGSSVDSYASTATPSLPWRLPGSTFRMRWECFRFICILIVAFEVPYYMVFISNHNSQEKFLVDTELGFRYFLIAFVELFFMADLVLRSRYFAYLDPIVMINVVNPEMIFSAYKASGFFMDLAAVVPIGLVMESVQGSVEDYSIIPRLLRLLRLRFVSELIQDLGDFYSLSFKMRLIASLLLGVVLLLHVVACIWFALALSWSSGSYSDGEEFSELSREECLHWATHFHNCSWVWYDCYGNIGASFPVEDSTSMYKSSFAYLRSMYWAVVALTGVGYGDIVAYSTAESYFAALWIYIGGIINFGIVGAMSSTISNLMASRHQYMEKLTTLDSLMEHLNISEKLRADIRRFYKHQFNNRKKAYESQLLSHLPDQLCYQISCLLHSEATRSVALFDSASIEFLDEVTGKFRHRTYQNGETLYVEGEMCHEFLVIMHGKVNIFFRSMKVPVGALHSGDCYSVNEFLLKKAHPATLTAVSAISSSVMTRDQFDVIQRKFADDLKDMKAEANEEWINDMARLRRITKNLDRLKLQPHVLSTTSMFYQRENHLQQNSPSRNAKRKRVNDQEAKMTAFMNRWDIGLTFCNIYNAFVIVFRICFYDHLHLSGNLFVALVAVDFFCDLYMVVDIYLKLYCFEMADFGFDNLISRKDINIVYSKSSRLKWDLVSSAPIYFLSEQYPLATIICRLPRLIRCLDLMHSIDEMIIQAQQAFASKNVSSYLSPLKLLFVLLLSAHYCACIFFWISERECHTHNNCWINEDHLVHEYHHSASILYTRCFYWALTTLALVGSREVVPRGFQGTMWAIVTCLFCMFVMGHIIGELSELILEVDKEAKEYKSRIDSFERFAKEQNLPESLRTRVGLFFKVQYESTHGEDLNETIHDLSANLKLTLMHEIYGAALITLPISRFLSYAQVNSLALRLRPDMYIPGDEIIAEQTFGNRLCILRKGIAAVFWTESVTNVAVLIEGCLFGEVAFFLPEQRRTATVKATAACEVLHISKHDWERLWRANGNVGEAHEHRYALHSILEWVHKRVERYEKATLAIAAKVKRTRMSRKIAQNLKGMVAKPQVSKIFKAGAPNAANKARSFITPEALVLEKKARYVLTKADAFIKQYRQYIIALHGESGVASSKSMTMSLNRRESDHHLQHRGPTNHLQALAVHQAHQKKKFPVNAANIISNEFIAFVSPVNKFVRTYIDDHHLRLLETECWSRMRSMAVVQHKITRMMSELIPPQRVSPAYTSPVTVAAAATRKVSAVQLSLANKSTMRRNSKRQLAPIELMRHPQRRASLVKLHSFHVDDVHALTRKASVAEPPHHHHEFRHRVLLSDRPQDISPIEVVGAGVKQQSGKKIHAIHLKSFASRITMNAKQLIPENAITDDERVGTLKRMKRCRSLPLFDKRYFAQIVKREEHERGVVARTANGIESSLLMSSTGVTFDILQRCRQPKFSTLFRVYRRYQQWNMGEAHRSSSSLDPLVDSGKSQEGLSKVKASSSSVKSSTSTFRRTSSVMFSMLHRQSRFISGATLPEQQPHHHARHHHNWTVNSSEFLALVKRLGKSWELFMLLIALYNSIAVPFKVCFVHDLVEVSSVRLFVWSICEYMLDLWCLVDIGYKLRGSLQLEQSMLTSTKRTDSSHPWQVLSVLTNLYSGFWYDLMAVLPLEGFVYLLPGFERSANYRHQWKFFCYLRLNKFLYARRVNALSDSLLQFLVYDIKVPISEARLYFSRSLSSYIIKGHFIACVWYAISIKGLELYETSWLVTTGLIEESSSFATSTSLATEEHQVATVPLGRKYARCMHFAIGSITTLWYGDIVSMNLLELFVEMGVILVSTYIYGSLVGAQGELIENHSRKKAIFEQNLSELQHYLVQNEVPKTLKKQIKQYYASIWRRRHGEEEFEAIANVSQTLKEDVVFASLQRFAWRVTIFRTMEAHFLRALLVQLHFVIVSEGEEVVMKGDVDKSMYFISHGRVVIKLAMAEVTKEKGEYFGELALLYGIPRRETCISLVISELYRLDQDRFDQLMIEFPEYATKVKEEWSLNEHKSASSGSILLLQAHGLGATAHQTTGERRGSGVNMMLRSHVDEQVPHSFVYRGVMEMLAQMRRVDYLEAKEIVSKGIIGARKQIKQIAGIQTARDFESHLNRSAESMAAMKSPRNNDIRHFDSLKNDESTYSSVHEGQSDEDLADSPPKETKTPIMRRLWSSPSERMTSVHVTQREAHPLV